MINILTKECDFEIANLYNKKIPNTGANKCCIFDDKPKFIYFSGHQQLYLLHRN